MASSKIDPDCRVECKLVNALLREVRELDPEFLLGLYRSGYRSAGWMLADQYHSPWPTGLTEAEVVELKIEDLEENQNCSAALDLYYYHWDKMFPDLLPTPRMRKLFESVRENSAEIDEILNRGEFG